MGSGKSSYIIEQLNDPSQHHSKFVIVLPSLTEVQRYKEGLSDQYRGKRSDIVALDTEDSERKADRFVRAVRDGKTVIVTHQLFTITNERDLGAFGNIGEYKLVIDETITLIGKKSIQYTDLKALVADGYMETIDHPKIEGLKLYNLLPLGIDYIDDGGEDRLRTIKAVSGRHVYQVDKKHVVFIVPPEKFKAFKEVTLLTYLFEGSETKAWLELFGINHDHRTFLYDTVTQKPVGTRYFSDGYGGRLFYPMITIIDHKINQIGVKKSKDQGEPLSKNWFNKQKSKGASIKKLSNNTRTFFTTISGATKEDMMWTCFKDHRDWIGTSHFDPKRKNVSGKYVDLSEQEQTFVSQTTRGTNDYATKHFLAFLVNVNPYPELVNFFKSHKIDLDENVYALSRVLQWTWRSAIRKGELIVLYLPSQRMRTLVEEWLSKF